MSNKIVIRRSSVPGKAPTVAQLLDGELGVNTHDGAVYLKKTAGTAPSVIEVGAHDVTGDVSGRLSKGGGALTLAESGVTAGDYTKVRVNAKGLVVEGLASSLPDNSDIAFTNPVTDGQVLQHLGGKWTNSDLSPTSASGTLTGWTLLSGTEYYKDFAHGLGTTNVVVSLYDATTNALVQAGQIVLLNNNVVRVYVTGNTRVLRITVIANGTTIVPQGVVAKQIQEGLLSGRPAAGTLGSLYFAYDSKVLYRDNGVAWEVALASSGMIRQYTYHASSMDSPNTPDFAVNALAPAISDPLNTALNVRQFSNTAEQGVCFTVAVPVGAMSVSFRIRGRAGSTHTGTAVVQHRIYRRAIPDGAAMPAWSGDAAFSSYVVPLDAFYHLVTQTFTLASLGMSEGNTYQIELTRAIGVANNLAFPWLVAEVSVVFD